LTGLEALLEKINKPITPSVLTVHGWQYKVEHQAVTVAK